MNKKKNKGFSLVELIVVVAIMAVLVGVLAPTYLRYVEKSRIQKDVSAIDEVMGACEVAMADEDINTTVGTTGQSIVITGGTNKTLGESGANELETEVAKTIKDINLTSNGLKGATVTITAKNTASGSVEVTVKAENVVSDDAVDALQKIDGATATKKQGN